MSNIKSIDITYNKVLLHVLYIKEEEKVKILTINKAPKFQYLELQEEIELLVNKEIKAQEAKEYKDEQEVEENGGWAGELLQEERDPEWEL